VQSEIPVISVVVPISERHDDIRELYQLYSDELNKMEKSFEFIFVVDGYFQAAFDELKKIKSEGHPVRIVKFPKNFGESVALMEGFQRARGEVVLTLASYLQIEPKDLSKVFAAYEEGADLVVTRRYPRKDPFINKLQSTTYHYLLRRLTGSPFRDITSGMRLIKKRILSEIVLYGDLHRFIPILALQKGFKVKEVNVAHRREDTQLRLVNPGIYLRRVLDMLTLFFLVKFTKKPLRFFGLIGSTLFLIGTALSISLAIEKILTSAALSNRPLLLLGILFMVFGIQTLSVGLVGELIIYSHAKEINEYTIEKIIE
jgi:glycosyltransferase involved in cell wall biosynthesis